MDETLKYTDDFGPTKILHVYEPGSGLRAVLVVDNVAAGPAIGGIRMAEDVTVDECFRLARAMTMKNIAAGLSHGGGKTVVYGNPKMDRRDKETIIRALACSLRDIKEYIPGPDMGTNEQCMAWIKDEIGRAVGIPSELGGIPLDEIGATGWGVFHSTEVAAEMYGFDLKGARIVLQGFGAVGKHAAAFLAEKGALIIGVSDSTGGAVNYDGLDLQELMALKNQGRSVNECSRAEAIAAEDLIGVECDVWIPAARPDVIHGDNVSRLRTKMVIQGANIPCTAAAETYLYEHNILSIPDFIANAGGVICAAMEYQGASKPQAMSRIEHTTRANTRHILERSIRENTQPRETAMTFARDRLKKAMGTKRWSIF